MSKSTEEAFCPECGWQGDASGLTTCPGCGAELSLIDAFREDDLMKTKEEKYPLDFLVRKISDDDYLE